MYLKELFIQFVLLWSDVCFAANRILPTTAKKISSREIHAGLYSRLWIRHCWLCMYLCRWLRRCFVSFSWRRALPSPWSCGLRAFCSAVWHWRLLAPRCRWALSRFCGSWLFSWALARDLFALHDGGVALKLHRRCSFVPQAGLSRLRTRCFWKRSWRLPSWDSSISSFTTFIAISFVWKKLQEQTTVVLAKSPERIWDQNWRCYATKSPHTCA